METEKDVIYKKTGDRELTLDIYKPETSGHTKTAIVLLHGGGFRFGDKSMMSLFGPELAKHGFVAVAPTYRLLGDAPWPAQIEDVKTAVRWIKHHAADLGVDSTRVAVQGFSAGGHLALMAGGTPDSPLYERNDFSDLSDSVAAVIAFFAPVEFAVDAGEPGISDASLLLGEKPKAEETGGISPIQQVTENFPPTFLLHGTADKMVPHITSQRMFQALEEKGVAAELHLYPNHTHEFVRLPSMMTMVQSEIALFLHRMVVDPDRYIKENLELNQFAKME